MRAFSAKETGVLGSVDGVARAGSMVVGLDGDSAQHGDPDLICFGPDYSGTKQDCAMLKSVGF